MEVVFPDSFLCTRHSLAIMQEKMPAVLEGLPEMLRKMFDMTNAKHWTYPVNAPTAISVIGGAHNIGDGINTFEMCDHRTGVIMSVTKNQINDYLKVNPVIKELS